MMLTALMFTALGYLSGSVLYARVFSRVFGKENMLEDSRDGNPGTANAFMYGGFLCGVLTLVCDLAKGALPVFFYMHSAAFPRVSPLLTALVIAAPVMGHIFPLFHGFEGGKGIAVTFGCLLGLLPAWQPLAALAFFFIFFSVILRVSPHFYRTLVSYVSALVGMLCMGCGAGVCVGFLLISAAVCARLHMSREERKKPEVNLLWMR